MTAKEFLQQAWIAYGEIDIKLERINRLQALATRTTTTLRSTPCGSSVSGSKIESAVTMIQEEMDQLAGEIQNLLAINKQVQEAINAIKNPTEKRILEYRYLCFFSWKQICMLIKTGKSNVFKLHDKALKNFPAV